MKGQTLLEVLIGLGVLVIVISAITISVIFSLSNNQLSEKQNLATQYSQEGMELVRTMRDSNYSSIQALSGTYCLANTCTSITSADSNCWTKGAQTCGQNISTPLGGFSREITILSGSSLTANCSSSNSKYEVTVTTYWTDIKCPSTSFALSASLCHASKIVTCLSDYNLIPTP